MSRVLLVNKYRRFVGGVERHIEDLTAGLLDKGHEVRLFTSEDLPDSGQAFEQAKIGHASAAAAVGQLFWNTRARKHLVGVIKEFQPDVVHMHSIYHQLSPSVLGVDGTPVVMTLHDYKLTAPCYSLVRDGDVCTLCAGRSLPVDAVRYKCVKDSVAKSIVCMAEAPFLRHQFLRGVDHFIVPSSFSKEMALRAGVFENSLSVVRWAVRGRRSSPVELNARARPSIGYIGRLHATKGITDLLDAWQRSGVGDAAQLLIAGSGEEEELVRRREREDSSITYLGFVEPSEVADALRRCDLIIMPSRAPETLGLSGVEALLAGKPLVVSGRGALRELVGPGVVELAEPLSSGLAGLLMKVREDAVGYINTLSQELGERQLSEWSFEAMIGGIVDAYVRAGAVIDPA